MKRMGGFLDLFRPDPEFGPGQLVLLVNIAGLRNHYLLIEDRRWARPEGDRKKQWVYSGSIMQIDERYRLHVVTGGSCILERHCVPVAGRALR